MSKVQIYRLFFALCGILGVFLQIRQDGWGMLLYYTVLSNILVFSFLLYLIYRESKEGSINQQTNLLRLKGSVTMAITITFLVYHFLLSPYVTYDQYFNLRNFLVHYIAPLGLILDTLFFDRRNTYHKWEPFSWTLLPIIYLILAIFNGLVTQLPIPGSPDSPYAYYFINLSKFGLQGVAINSLFIAVAYIIIGYVLLGLKKFIRPKESK